MLVLVAALLCLAGGVSETCGVDGDVKLQMTDVGSFTSDKHVYFLPDGTSEVPDNVILLVNDRGEL